MALVSARNVPLFLIIAAPLVAQGLAAMVREIQNGAWPNWLVRTVTGLQETAAEFGSTDSISRVHAVSLGGFAVIALALYGGSTSPKWQAAYEAKRYPVAALNKFPGDSLGSRVFTDDEWGDYLVYRRFPEGGKVFVDGRSDFYGPEFGKKYLNVANVQYDWQATLDRYRVDKLLLRADSALAAAAKESRRWRVQYDDGVAIVFASAEANINKPDNGPSRREITGVTETARERTWYER
jgi:hypothetical protein